VQKLAYETAIYQQTTNNIDLSRDQINNLTQIGNGNVALQQPTSASGDGAIAVGAGAQTGPNIAGGAGGAPGAGGPITIVDGGPGADDIQVGGTGNVQDATLIGSAVGEGAASGGIGGTAAGGGSGGGGVVAEPGSTVGQGGGTTAGGIASTAGGAGSNVGGGIGGTAAGSGGVAAGAASGGVGQAATGGSTIDQSVDIAAAGGDLNQQTAGGDINQPTDVNVAGGNITDLDAQINQGVQLADVAEPEPLATEAPLDGSVPDPDVDLGDPMA
jgi:hypothetical protein